MPILELLLRRVSLAAIGPVVVATSDLAADDPIAELAAMLDVAVVRGSESDVLGRFVAALDTAPADHVVRITADCPLSDPAVLAEVYATHRTTGADYTSNTLVRTYPDGLDVEVIRAEMLRSVAAATHDPSDREHVTPGIYRRPDRYRLAAVTTPLRLGHLRWTVDTMADLAFVRRLADHVGDPVTAHWTALVDADPGAAPPDGLLLPLLPGSWSEGPLDQSDWRAIAGAVHARPDPATWWGRCLVSGGPWFDERRSTFARAWEVRRHGARAGWAALEWDGTHLRRWGAVSEPLVGMLTSQLDAITRTDLQFASPDRHPGPD